MKLIAAVLAIASTLVVSPGWAEETPFLLERKIPLGEVRGRIDHLAVDLKRNRLFVAELENDTVAVVDLDASKVMRVISGLKRPQGLGYHPWTDALYVGLLPSWERCFNLRPTTFHFKPKCEPPV